MPYYPEKTQKPGETPSGGKREIPGRKKALRWGLCALAAVMLVYGATRLILYESERSASRNTSRELQELRLETLAPETTPEPEAEPELKPARMEIPANAEAEAAAETAEAKAEADSETLSPVPYPENPGLICAESFLTLRRKSSYIIGWLTLDGVEEAVVQKDNTFFLKHDALGKRNGNGAIFLDEAISLKTRPYLLMLYGHNMKSGNMFGSLKKYKAPAYFYSHQVISFDSMYEEGKYAVFAVMEMDTTPGVARWYNLWSLNSDSRADREEAIRTLERRSAVSCTLDVRAEDQILLLVTCLDGDTERLVVAARRLRNEETENTLTLRSSR